MKSGSRIYSAEHIPTYDEVLEITRRAREMRSETIAEMFSTAALGIRSLVRKMLHIDSHGNHGKATLS